MTPMHIAIICESLIPHDHAGEQAKLLAHALAKQGHRVSLLCAAQLDAGLSEDIELICKAVRPPRSAWGVVRFCRWLRSQLSELDADHVVSFTPIVSAELIIPCAGTASGFAKRLRSLQGSVLARLVAWPKSIAPNLLLRQQLEKRALIDPRVKSMITDNLLIQSEIESVGQIAADKIAPLDPVVRTEPVTDSQAAQLRQRLGRGLDMDPDSAWLVFPFRSARIDGIEPMVMAFKMLMDREVDAVLMLAGPYRYTHLAWVAQLGMRDRVRFLGTPDHTEQIIAAADFIVQPTAYDPGGDWVMAALAQGRPVITTDASGAAQWIQPAKGTVLSSPIDIAKLAEVLAEAVVTRWGVTEAEHGDLSPHEFSAQARAQAIQALLGSHSGSPGSV